MAEPVVEHGVEAGVSGERDDEAEGEQEPADRVPRLAARDHRPDNDERQAEQRDHGVVEELRLVRQDGQWDDTDHGQQRHPPTAVAVDRDANGNRTTAAFGFAVKAIRQI